MVLPANCKTSGKARSGGVRPKSRLLRLVKPDESRPIIVTGMIDAEGLLVGVRSEYYRDTPHEGVIMQATVSEAMRVTHHAECWRRLRGLPHWTGEPWQAGGHGGRLQVILGPDGELLEMTRLPATKEEGPFSSATAWMLEEMERQVVLAVRSRLWQMLPDHEWQRPAPDLEGTSPEEE
jgi:hypothetical protein